MGDSGVAPETAFSINKSPIIEFIVEKLSHPSNRVPDTCRIYTKVP
jgi:hypothetical protein